MSLGAGAAPSREPYVWLSGTCLGLGVLPQFNSATCEELPMALIHSHGASRDASGKTLASPRPHRSLLSVESAWACSPVTLLAGSSSYLAWGHRVTRWWDPMVIQATSQPDGIPYASRDRRSLPAREEKAEGLGPAHNVPAAATSGLLLGPPP